MLCIRGLQGVVHVSHTKVMSSLQFRRSKTTVETNPKTSPGGEEMNRSSSFTLFMYYPWNGISRMNILFVIPSHL